MLNYLACVSNGRISNITMSVKQDLGGVFCQWYMSMKTFGDFCGSFSIFFTSWAVKDVSAAVPVLSCNRGYTHLWQLKRVGWSMSASERLWWTVQLQHRGQIWYHLLPSTFFLYSPAVPLYLQLYTETAVYIFPTFYFFILLLYPFALFLPHRLRILLSTIYVVPQNVFSRRDEPLLGAHMTSVLPNYGFDGALHIK